MLRILVRIELDKLNSWFAVNKLSLNDSKTNLVEQISDKK